MTGTLAIDVVLFLYALVAPGVALAYLALDSRDPLILMTVGLTIGMLCLPFLNFALAMVLGTHVHPGLLLTVATVILAATAARHLRVGTSKNKDTAS